jgi:hypothetical protein
MNDRELTRILYLPDERPHIHGFHAYPARFSPALAEALLEGITPGSVVFDPFAGGATTLVEARLAGCAAWGNDLNPVATLLCRVKAQPLPPKVLGALDSDLVYLRRYLTGAVARRDEDEPVRLPPGKRIFQPNVYWELQTITAGIDRIRHPHNREVFRAALSSIVNRVSLQARESQPDRRISADARQSRTLQLFYAQALRLLADLRTFSKLAPDGSLRVWQNDARELADVPDASVDRIITSPPYGGTYDYAEMHALRTAWLGLDWTAFERLEIGARRHQETKDAYDRFFDDVRDVFKSLRRVARPGAALYWVIADGVIARKAYRGDALSRSAAEQCGWTLQRSGSVERPIWSPEERTALGAKKREYLLAFT